MTGNKDEIVYSKFCQQFHLSIKLIELKARITANHFTLHSYYLIVTTLTLHSYYLIVKTVTLHNYYLIITIVTLYS